MLTERIKTAAKRLAELCKEEHGVEGLQLFFEIFDWCGDLHLEASDKANHPSHYQGDGITVIDVIHAFKLNFLTGSAAKYVLRGGKKDGNDIVQEYKKAIQCLNMEIDRIVKEEEGV